MVKSIIKKAKKNTRVEKKGHKISENKKKHSKIKVESKRPPIKSKIVQKEKKEQKINSATEINSFQELENKILEKFEENKPELTELLEIKPVEISEQKEAPKKEVVKKEVVKKDSSEKDELNKDHKARVEAILFAVGKYLDEENIAQLCDMDKRHTKKALEELRKDYDEKETALMIVQEGNSWKINVREKYLSLVRKVVADTELSKSIMETLAIIAWKTPVYQNEVVRIRGNKCYDHIAELENAGFVTKDKKGRSFVLKTTDKFYNYFDIDQKHLHGVMSEAKMPVTQMKLEEDKPEEVTYSREKLLQTLETIETKSIVQTEEDKTAQKEFLHQIHQKIDAASKRTDEVIADIPRPMHETHTEPVIEEVPPELKSYTVVEKDEEDIVINTDVANGSEHHFQKPEEQPQKVKQLTKKQLEKKFKEELQRVKEKSEKK
jgi:segregation and condensation protein B